MKGKLLFLYLAAQSAYAGLTGLPWETPMQRMGNSISGPVAATCATIGISVAGIALMAGHDFHVMGMNVSKMALAGGIAVLGPPTLLALYGVTGAVV